MLILKLYVNARKEQYKQEKSRSIIYVSFDAAATAEDSAAALAGIQEQKEAFAAAEDAESFLNRVGTENPYFDGYVLKSRLQVANADTIMKLNVGEIYGPYLDGGNYTYAKMIDTRRISGQRENTTHPDQHPNWSAGFHRKEQSR